jgi:hypothetical protein
LLDRAHSDDRQRAGEGGCVRSELRNIHSCIDAGEDDLGTGRTIDTPGDADVAGADVADASSDACTAAAVALKASGPVRRGRTERFTTVDYQLDATEIAKSCDPTGQQCMAVLYNPTDTLTGGESRMTRDEFTGSLTLDDVPSSGGVCSCTLHMEYSDVTPTNLTSGHVYRLDPIVGDSP